MKMFAHLERRDIIFIVLIITVLFGGLWIYKGKRFFNTIYGFDHKIVAVNEQYGREALKGNAKKQKKTQAQQYKQNFEQSLNDFLKDMYAKMTEYRKRRAILNDVINPQNLQNPTYISEGYQLTQKIVPDLRTRSENMIRAFHQKDAEIKSLVANRPAAAQQKILRAWSNVKAKQGTLYVNYFSIEQDVLGSYEALMYLYQQNKDTIQYNQDSNTITFPTPELNARAAELRNAITSLKNKQAALSK